MPFHCIRLLCALGLVAAQDLFEHENKFLARYGLTTQAVERNATNRTTQLAAASGESWWKTLTPMQDTMLCIDVPGGVPRNGLMLWLWECNGMDSQIWVFDNWEIRYGANEGFCIDGREMQNDQQLMLWECNGNSNQRWGYDFDPNVLRIFLDNTATCMDWYDGDYDNGQPLHIWECGDGWTNQMWGLWDSPAPSLSPTPGPTPSWDHLLPRCSSGDQHGWPVFNSQAELQVDPWGKYFQLVYGEVPSRGYPICTFGQSLLYMPHIETAGVTLPVKYKGDCPSKAGDWYGMMSSSVAEASWSNWIWNPNLSAPRSNGQGLPANTWVEVHHMKYAMDGSATWLYYTAGSGIWAMLGNTKVYDDHLNAVQDLLKRNKCAGFFCEGDFADLYKAMRDGSLDTIQFLKHADMKCPGPMSIEIIDIAGSGANTCGQAHSGKTRFKAGWGADHDCDCDNSAADRVINCKGFGIRGR